MVEPVKLVRLGETVDEVVIIEWLVNVGSRVAQGDALVRVETDKVEVDVVAPRDGTVTELLVQEGDEVRTGESICMLDG